ncbi:MAG: pyridoxal-phosphate dependent enzyme, partial [Rhodothermales bacterium]|nr:pyridoxal-phosphate dependent enzyme [Rhodothermales bacterium]
KRVAEMEAAGAEVRRAPGSYEEVVEVSRRAAKEEGLYDANPGGANTALQVAAYAPLAGEIVRGLGAVPAAVALPVSNGTLFAGVYEGFARLREAGTVSHLPALVAGSTAQQNPIVRAWRRHLDHVEDLPPERLRETPTNEPLVNWRSLDGEEALRALRATGGWAADVSDRTLTKLSALLRQREGLNVLPAATAGLAALVDRHRREPLSAGPFVAVLTARKP